MTTTAQQSGQSQAGWTGDAAGAAQAGFRHESLFYAGQDEFLGGTVGHIEHALERDEPVLVAVAPQKTQLLRHVLGRNARHVAFADMHALGRNPARIIPVWERFLHDQARDARSALGIGEPVWPGRTVAELEECERHEWLLNLAFGSGRAWRLVCPYDRDALDEDVLAAARDSHPFNCCGESTEANGYREPDWPEIVFGGRLLPPGGAVTQLSFSLEHLAEVRHVVARIAAGTELSAQRAQDLVLAASELAANSVRHGGGAGEARIWQQDGALLCEVSDAGRMDSPLTGREQPSSDQPSGRGLWLVNQLCDLVQIRSDECRTVVRVQVDLDS